MRKYLIAVAAVLALAGCNGKPAATPKSKAHSGALDCWADKPGAVGIHMTDSVAAKYLGYIPAVCP